MLIKKRKQTESYVKEPDYHGPLARLFGLSTPERDGVSKFHAIHSNDAALAWRLLMIEQARTSIDAQYYSWHADTSGLLLLNKLIETANRGVRIRLLLDDLHTLGADRQIAALNHHENIEVRLFNPFSIRKPVWLIRTFELLWKLDVLNHRMHNKLLIADNAIAIIGGRNIGDEYFGLSNQFIFRDLDVLIAGSEVQSLSKCFDVFWNDKNSKPVRKLITMYPGKFAMPYLMKLIHKKVLSSSHFVRRIEHHKKTYMDNIHHHMRQTEAPARIIYDIPSIDNARIERMMQSLYKTAEATQHSLTVISAYFVPTTSMLDSFKALIDRGVKIRVLTNSLASIDVTAVFSGYEKFRKQLLMMGVELFEFRSEPADHSIYTAPEITTRRYSLHAKSIIYDTDTIYIGTLNLDPRSDSLNTEIGVLIESDILAKKTIEIFEQDINNDNYWRVSLDTDNRLLWTCGNKTMRRQPARHIWQRLLNLFCSFLPIYRHL